MNHNPAFSSVSRLYRMTPCMRWYGPSDNVSLSDIRQAGGTGVVTALHHLPNGAIWPLDEIRWRKKQIEKQGLKWEVVESLAVHEAIKTQQKGFEQYIENYKKSIYNLSQCGIKVITYNFMPVLDWTRTDLGYELADGSKALRFEMVAYTAFDLFMLKRPHAKKDYDKPTITKAKEHFEAMTEEEKRILQKNIVAGLPGSEAHFSIKSLREALTTYQHIDQVRLQKHLIHFLKEIVPIAEKCGVKLAIHPDDPPFSILGLPRILSTAADMETIVKAIPSQHNGFCFCSGSLGVLEENDLPAIIRQFADRIHFIHLRNIRRNRQGDFYEDNHLEGNVDMYAVISALVNAMNLQQNTIPVRPDHGHQMLDDLYKKTKPGYSAIGRLKGLAEIRGLELGILRARQTLKKTSQFF